MESRQSNENITTFTDSIVFDVIKDIAARAELGLAKYNMTMDREDLIASDWVQHAYEECLDMSLYLKRLKKDMLAMEEELRAFKTQAMIKERWDEIKQEDEVRRKYKQHYTARPTDKKAEVDVTKTDGTGVVYNTVPEPNEEKPPIIIKYTWHR
jgi:hypothetical protein